MTVSYQGKGRFEGRYSRFDRSLHGMAFSSIEIQKSLSEIEDRIYSGRISSIVIDRPVFITSLPRAGTTLLLEVLYSLDSFAAHTYRNMPFLMIPLLWDAISSPFQVSATDIERAHGDGMSVGYDSPEAFEEVLWHSFFPEMYLADRIMTWSAESDSGNRNDRFELFLRRHMRKLISLRMSKGSDGVVRYLSKNNVNISRFPKLIKTFPDAMVVIPYRNPVDHAASMLRQHLNFERIHADEPFTRRYMSDVCHFDFGADFRPIDFGGWLGEVESIRESARDINFWIKYWCAGFEHVLSNLSGSVVLISYDRLCADAADNLQRIAERVGIDESSRLVSFADRFRVPNNYNEDALGMSGDLIDEARGIHDRLLDETV